MEQENRWEIRARSPSSAPGFGLGPRDTRRRSPSSRAPKSSSTSSRTSSSTAGSSGSTRPAESLFDSYRQGRPRPETYEEIVERILAPVRAGRTGLRRLLWPSGGLRHAGARGDTAGAGGGAFAPRCCRESRATPVSSPSSASILARAAASRSKRPTFSCAVASSIRRAICFSGRSARSRCRTSAPASIWNRAGLAVLAKRAGRELPAATTRSSSTSTTLSDLRFQAPSLSPRRARRGAGHPRLDPLCPAPSATRDDDPAMRAALGMPPNQAGGAPRSRPIAVARGAVPRSRRLRA